MAELWPFPAHGTVTEVLEWRTDVLQSRESEQRLSLRSAPREILTLRHRLDRSGLAQALSMARRGMAQDWVVPLWMMAVRSGSDISAADMMIAADAANADYRAPGFAIVAANGGPAHLLQIAAVRPDGLDLAAPVGADLIHPIVAPARLARLLPPLEVERQRGGRASVTARFLLQDSADLSGLRGAALYITVDTSASMAGAKIAAAIAAVQALLGELAASVPPVLRNDLCVVLWSSAISGLQLYRDADQVDLAALANWLGAAATTGGGTDFEMAVSEAPGFFAGAGSKRRIVLFVTDGEPSPVSSASAAASLLAGIADVEVFGVNIGLAETTYTALLDNTGVDGVPVIGPGDSDTLRDALLGALTGLPRYRGRGVLTDPGLLRQPLRETLSQSFEAIDSGLGPLTLEPLRDLAERGSVLTLKTTGLANHWARRRWLHGLRGRARAFWLPTWEREFDVLAPGLVGDAFLIVAASTDPANLIGQHLMIDLPGGPVLRQITSALYDPFGLRLLIAPLDRAVPVGTPCHLLILVRPDTDRIEWHHGAAGSEMSLTVIETPDEA
jgi:uncharacterized protein YegL